MKTRAFNISLANPEIHIHENGSQFFSFKVLPSMTSIAATSDGKIYIRIGDKCHPVRSEDLLHLTSEKNAFQWELVRHDNIQIKDINPDEFFYFNDSIRKSDKVNDFVNNLFYTDS